MASLEKIAHFLKNAKGFYTVLDKVKITSAGNGSCTAEFKVEEDHTNPMGGLHGGFSATLIDTISTLGLKTLLGDVKFTSTDMNLIYLKGATIGDEIVVEARTIRQSKNIAHLEAEVKLKKSGHLLVKGSHTAYIENLQ